MAAKSKINKGESAVIFALTELGNNPTGIAKKLGLNHHTVISHIKKGYDDPQVIEMIAVIKAAELSELHSITWKARSILNAYLDEIITEGKKFNVISIVAILDRCFTQSRLIQDKATMILDSDRLITAMSKLNAGNEKDQEHLEMLQSRGKWQLSDAKPL